MFNPLTALAYDATNIKSVAYQNQRTNEHVHIFLRQHFVTNLTWIIPAIILATLPVLYPFLPLTLRQPINDLFSTPIFSALETRLMLIVYYLAITYFAILGFLRWYFNILLATNYRIVDLTFTPPFRWQITEAQLEEVQDVRYTQGGILSIIFNLGDLFVQTAGTSQNITIAKIPQPNRVHELLIRLLP